MGGQGTIGWLTTRIGAAAFTLSQQAWLQGPGRGLYRLIWHTFRRRLARQPGVTGLYLKGSFARGELRPGLSDIDVFVIVDARLPLPDLLRLLDRIRNMKKWPPFRIIGEVEIATVKDLRFCGEQPDFCYLDLFDWKWEWGEQPLGPYREKRSQPSELAALYVEVFSYLHHFPMVRIHRHPEMGLAVKLQGLLNKLGSGLEANPEANVTEVHRRALEYLDERIQQLVGDLPAARLPESDCQSLGPFTAHTSFHRLRFRYLDDQPPPTKNEPAAREGLLVFPELWISDTLGRFLHYCWFHRDLAPEALRAENNALFESCQRQVLLMQWRGYYVNTFRHDPEEFGPRTSLLALVLASYRLCGRTCDEKALRAQTARTHMRSLYHCWRLA
ncbi:MAG: nucleotidyltransferase domain-containing protein [Lysobacterales bacterium]